MKYIHSLVLGVLAIFYAYVSIILAPVYCEFIREACETATLSDIDITMTLENALALVAFGLIEAGGIVIPVGTFAAIRNILKED